MTNQKLKAQQTEQKKLAATRVPQNTVDRKSVFCLSWGVSVQMKLHAVSPWGSRAALILSGLSAAFRLCLLAWGHEFPSRAEWVCLCVSACVCVCAFVCVEKKKRRWVWSKGGMLHHHLGVGSLKEGFQETEWSLKLLPRKSIHGLNMWIPLIAVSKPKHYILLQMAKHHCKILCDKIFA